MIKTDRKQTKICKDDELTVICGKPKKYSQGIRLADSLGNTEFSMSYQPYRKTFKKAKKNVENY